MLINSVSEENQIEEELKHKEDNEYVVEHASNYNRNDYFDFSSLYLGTIHSSTNLYLVPQSLPRNEEEGKGVTKFFLSLQPSLLYLQISLEASQ